MKLAAFVLALSTFSVSAANWQLDSSQSSLHFISVKNELVAESHQFSQLSGKWDGENASVSIPVRAVCKLIFRSATNVFGNMYCRLKSTIVLM